MSVTSTQSELIFRPNMLVKTILKQDGQTYSVHQEGEHGGICGQLLRGGRFCTMDHGHRGRHASVTYVCDGCGVTRRSAVQAYGRDGEYEYGMRFCFMCASPQVNGSYY